MEEVKTCKSCEHDCHCDNVWCGTCEMESRDDIGHACVCKEETNDL